MNKSTITNLKKKVNWTRIWQRYNSSIIPNMMKHNKIFFVFYITSRPYLLESFTWQVDATSKKYHSSLLSLFRQFYFTKYLKVSIWHSLPVGPKKWLTRMDSRNIHGCFYSFCCEIHHEFKLTTATVLGQWPFSKTFFKSLLKVSQLTVLSWSELQTIRSRVWQETILSQLWRVAVLSLMCVSSQVLGKDLFHLLLFICLCTT